MLESFDEFLHSIIEQKSLLQLLSLVVVVTSSSLVTFMELMFDERNAVPLMVYG